MKNSRAKKSAVIPFADPGWHYKKKSRRIQKALARVLKSGRYLLGAELENFEREFANYSGSPHALGVASGTDALLLSLWAAGVGRGDGVITVSMTTVATVTAIERLGAIPILIDVHPQSLTLDPECLKSCLHYFLRKKNPPVRAIVPVHLYGQMADMKTILEIARPYGIPVIEDCAQAHGARQNGQMAGTLGQFGAFSFYPTKNLAAFGDAGAVITTNGAAAKRIARIRQYGWNEKRISIEPGINSRMDEIQAAILRIQLDLLDKENRRRIQIAEIYERELKDTDLILPDFKKDLNHVYHQYVIRSRDRDRLQKKLARRAIETAVRYAVPIHLQPAYKKSVKLFPSELKVTAKAVREILSLPIHPGLSDAQVLRVTATLKSSVNS